MPYQAHIERAQKPRSGVALGGLGCGWFEIRQDGTFHNWNIFNNRPSARGRHFPHHKLHGHSALFFLVRYQVQGEHPRIRLLQVEESHGAAGIDGHEFQYIFPWLDGVDRIDFEGSVPYATLRFAERDLPFDITLRAWSPFIPHDAKHSALPVAFFDFTVVSKAGQPVDVTLLASMRNCVGYDVREKLWTGRVAERAGLRVCELGADRMPEQHASAGTMALASCHPESRVYSGWGHIHPYYERLLRERELPEVEEAEARNGSDAPGGPRYAKHECFGSVGRTVTLRPGEKLEHSFLFAWDFPNRLARVRGDEDGTAGYLEEAEGALRHDGAKPHLEGHYYSNFLSGAAEVAFYAAEHAAELRAGTERFHAAFHDTSLPGFVTDQINSQLNTFRTSTWFTKAGDFGVLEGLSPTKSYAGLATTDVAMYGHVMTAALFPELDRAVIRAHARFQQPNGVICHSITQNFRMPDPREANGKRLDMPAQYAYMALRCGLWADDRDFLREIWPSVKAALDYVLRERDPNGDLLPDMQGIMCSYDNFPMYGAAPYVATQWLAAIAAAVESARLLGDEPARARYAEVLARGAEALEAAAWNGRYYRLSAGGDEKEREGCLTDQVIGLWACHLADLPGFLRPERVASALASVMEMNYAPDQGLRNCQWPGDEFLHPVAPDCWVDQANTCWTGVELGFASLLIYEGRVAEGLEVIRNVDARHRRLGIYWDHQEFGGHYFRPMSAWGIVNAALGLRLRAGEITFAPKIGRGDCRLFFATPHGYGHYEEKPGEIRVSVASGRLVARRLRAPLPPGTQAADWSLHDVGDSSLRAEADCLVVDLPTNFALEAGRSLALLRHA